MTCTPYSQNKVLAFKLNESMSNFSYFTVLNIVPLVKFSEQGIETKSCLHHLFCVPGKKNL